MVGMMSSRGAQLPRVRDAAPTTIPKAAASAGVAA